MADESKKSYPMLGIKNWWLLRKKFDTKIPSVVDGDYLATVLSMSVGSAQTNVLPSLRIIGLVDQDGKPTDLAKRWRDAKEYAKVCKEIMEKVYPKSLTDAAPDPSKNKDDIKRWFKKTGVGDAAARMMTAFYTLLYKADVEGEKSIQETVKKPAEKERSKSTPKGKPASKDKMEEPGGEDQIVNQFPEIHINVQVHVSADSTPEQVDHLFASIAKHLKEFSIRKPK